jgi:hypothetical protein
MIPLPFSLFTLAPAREADLPLTVHAVRAAHLRRLVAL